MWIEMRATGRVSAAQKAVPENLRAIGHLVVGAHPAIEAITAICGAGFGVLPNSAQRALDCCGNGNGRGGFLLKNCWSLGLPATIRCGVRMSGSEMGTTPMKIILTIGSLQNLGAARFVRWA